jgi:hypothetical protein
MARHFSAERAGLRPTFYCYCIHLNFEAKIDVAPETKRLRAVRKQQLNVGFVSGVHQRELLQLAHAAGGFGAEQVALAGVHAKDFSGGGDFEAFFCTAVSLQLHFGLGCVSGHCKFLSR